MVIVLNGYSRQRHAVGFFSAIAGLHVFIIKVTKVYHNQGDHWAWKVMESHGI